MADLLCMKVRGRGEVFGQGRVNSMPGQVSA